MIMQILVDFLNSSYLIQSTKKNFHSERERRSLENFENLQGLTELHFFLHSFFFFQKKTSNILLRGLESNKHLLCEIHRQGYGKVKSS